MDEQPPADMPPTLCAAFRDAVASRPDAPALRAHGASESLTWTQFADSVRQVAGGLAARGIGHGDTVAMMLTNRPEVFLVDMAALHRRATPLSVYNTSSPEQLVYLFEHAAASVVVTEKAFVDRVEAARAQLPGLEHVIVVDDPDSWSGLHVTDAPALDPDAAQADDVAVLIYTSGTTGPPKGVELTHRNLITQFASLNAILEIPRGAETVSWLPLAHVADRAAGYYLAVLTASTINTVADAREIMAALPAVRPASFMAVPRIWEKVKGALEQQAPDPSALPEEAKAAIRAKIGMDRCGLPFTGAAPIAAEVLDYYDALGLQICEAWGMTESSAAGACTRPGDKRFGTVGRAMPFYEVAIADDGELLIRGDAVMRGYRNDPERTAEAVDPEGWLHTGDLATRDDDGFITIVGRKKELIINAAGKNMSPNNIENAIKAESPLIGPMMVIGDKRPYISALIVLDPEVRAVFEGDVEAEVAAAVERGNARLSRVEQIKRYTILDGDWLPGGDELTPTMKLKRAPIADKYAETIDSMYSLQRT